MDLLDREPLELHASIPLQDQWVIYADERAQWHWKHVAADGALLQESQRGFEFYLDCYENAKRYGYFAFEMPDI